MQFERILDALPEWDSFYTVDELDQRTMALAEKYPTKVTVTVGGHSRNGHPIHVIKIGEGKRTGLFYACPHPNEPIGSLVADHLAEVLCQDDELLNSLDMTFYLIKCVDPDGTKMNEGWFKGPFTVENYARNFFRPASFEQVEWSFPVEYKTLHFDSPLPETKVLMKLIEDLRPDFIYSLHNAGFGGVYAYLSKDLPAWYETLYALAKKYDLPMSLGEPEMPYAIKLADAVYKFPSIKDSYEFLAENTDKDPGQIIRAGSSAYGYSQEFCNPLTLVCELPYFYDARVDNLSSTDVIRRDAVLNRLERTEKLFASLKAEYDAVAEHITHTSPLRTAVEHYFETMSDNLQAEKSYAEKSPDMEKPATVAELFDNEAVNPFYHLLLLGMVLRLLDEARTKGPRPEFDAAIEAAERIFQAHHEAVVANLDYSVIPIRKLVGMQLGAGLEALAMI